VVEFENKLLGHFRFFLMKDENLHLQKKNQKKKPKLRSEITYKVVFNKNIFVFHCFFN
jgi:hypothetical protein